MDPEDDLLKDVEIELEDVPSDFAPTGDEDVEDAQGAAPVAPTLPDDDQDDIDDAAPAAAKKQDKEEDDDDEGRPDWAAQVEAAERRSRQVQAESLVRAADADARLVRGQRAQADVSLQLVAEKIDSFYAALARARDEGDTSTEIAIQRNIAQAENIRSEIERAKASYPDPDQIVARAQHEARQIVSAPLDIGSTSVGVGIKSSNQLAIQWAKANPWMQTNEKANEFVLQQSQAMSREGWDSTKRGYYAELSRRVNLQYPSLKVTRLQAPKKAATPNGRKSQVAPMRPASAAAGSGTPAASKGRFVLTAAEQVTMRRMKLDPSNKEHQRYWARQRLESARGANN